MKDLKQINLTIRFWDCSEDAKKDILNSVMNDVTYLDKDMIRDHSYDYINWIEEMLYIVDFK